MQNLPLTQLGKSFLGWGESHKICFFSVSANFLASELLNCKFTYKTIISAFFVFPCFASRKRQKSFQPTLGLCAMGCQPIATLGVRIWAPVPADKANSSLLPSHFVLLSEHFVPFSLARGHFLHYSAGVVTVDP